MEGDPVITDLAVRAARWVAEAAPAQLWDALLAGDVDARVGMPGAAPHLATLAGPGTVLDELQARPWAAGAAALAGDPPALAAWFAGDAAAQAAARHEMLASIAETHFDLGAWEWKE